MQTIPTLLRSLDFVSSAHGSGHFSRTASQIVKK